MPPRSDPTARQVRLGTELRKLREAAGLTSKVAGERLGGGTAQISHIESGRYGVSGARVRHMAALYSAQDMDVVDALAAMAEERGKGWWERYRPSLPVNLLDLAELEHHATFLRSIQLLAVPGIFQTEEYAHAIFSSGNPGVAAKELALWIDHRLSRRQIFDRETPPPFEAIIHEAALRIPYGSRKATRAQLSSLLDVCDWPSVAIRVIPFAIEAFHGAAQPMLYAGGPVPALDTVQVDDASVGSVLDATAQLRKYRDVYSSIHELSLTTEKSRDFIHRIAKET
ncbi:helix-turn-helix domain-containing protein [Streptomyces sp. BI20]|uniref:helix-turn-helix domain-containing protein n=1 Tax=Streptomyces sp. BI20 TaxID=3403460 RepID=UPI003C78E1E6